jgi:transcriptional regulator with XRE-family HTH domain
MNDGHGRVKSFRDDRELTQDCRRLKRRRIMAGLTLRGAAELAGCHFTTIGQLERGERSAGPGTLKALAEAYGCEIADIIPPEPAPARKGVAA